MSGIIWRTPQINPGIALSLALVSLWNGVSMCVPFLWLGHLAAWHSGSEKEHLKKGMAIPGELGRTCLGFSDLALETFQLHFYQTLLDTEGINMAIFKGGDLDPLLCMG